MLSDSYLNPILPEACQFSSVLHSEGALTHSLNLLDEYSYRTYVPEAVNITDKANITLHCMQYARGSIQLHYKMYQKELELCLLCICNRIDLCPYQILLLTGIVTFGYDTII